MKVKELIAELQKIPQEKEIIITSMDDNFCCSDFEVHSYIPECDEEDTAIEIILGAYINDFELEADNE